VLSGPAAEGRRGSAGGFVPPLDAYQKRQVTGREVAVTMGTGPTGDARPHDCLTGTERCRR
jgi:hypothetical protein